MKIPYGKKDRNKQLQQFANDLMNIEVEQKFSARGWCYVLEGMQLCKKSEFYAIEDLINECRKKGFLPVDFTLEEEYRLFAGVEIPETFSPEEYAEQRITNTIKYMHCGYTPDWWSGENYYIQMLVEKIDLKVMFEPICDEYHIPIATAGGWSSIRQRAEFCRRFKEMEAKGYQCVLLYCGDFDPIGLRIPNNLMKNLEDIKNIVWDDGESGYDPKNLKIYRFGLNYDFIKGNNLTWIDNLVTGSGGEIAKEVNGKIVQGQTIRRKPHPLFNQPDVQDYLKKYGIRKVEANALAIIPKSGKDLCRDAIECYLGTDVLQLFKTKQQIIIDRINAYKKRMGLDKSFLHD